MGVGTKRCWWTEGIREYLERRMVEVGGKGDPRWGKIRWGWCLGSEGFVARMKERLEELARKPRREESWAGEAVEEREEELAERVLWTGLRELGHRRLEEAGVWDRYLLAKLIHGRTRVSVGSVARRMGLRTRAGMSSCISLVGRRILEDPKLAKRWKSLSILEYSD